MNTRIVTSNKSQISIIGKLKIGEKATSQNGKEYPRSIDYFRATGNFAEFFHQKFGKKPTQIKIMFANENALKQVFVLQDKEKYAESDGLNIEYRDMTSKTWKQQSFGHPDECAKFMEEYKTKLNKRGVEWKKYLSIDFVLPELETIFGFWRFETKAEKSMIDSITNMFDAAVNMYGQISFVPFWLSVEMKESKSFDENRKFPVVSLTPAINPIIHAKILRESTNPIQDLIIISQPKTKAIEPPKKETITPARFAKFKELLKSEPEANLPYLQKFEYTQDQKTELTVILNDILKIGNEQINIKIHELWTIM